MAENKSLIPTERIEQSILLIRGHKIMLDRDLAILYGVSTKVLNQAVKRHRDRFPEDFMFQLTKKEALNLISQNAISNWGGKRKLPRVFTQEGVAMLSSVLNSENAILVNIQIMRAFVQLRRMLFTNHDLRRKIEMMERRYDKQFAMVFKAIKDFKEIKDFKDNKGFKEIKDPKVARDLKVLKDPKDLQALKMWWVP